MPEGRVAEWSSRPTILLVLEERKTAARLQASLESGEPTVIWVRSREEAVNVLDSSQVDVLVSELRGARIRGLSLLALARQRNPELGGVLIIAPGEETAATEALGRGVVDFQTPPLNLAKISATVDRIIERQRLVRELAAMGRRIDETFGFPGVIGLSGAMTRVRAHLAELAPLDLNVLLVGEPGTGKDLLAEVIHHNSPRRNAALVKTHCPALSSRALTRELFGTAGSRGRPRRPGRFEIAADGTIYLDGIDRVQPELQARIAGLLRTRQLRPQLDAAPIELSIRVVASSEADPETLFDRGGFDESLFELLAEARIDLPPLRHRRPDIAPLARHFLNRFAAESGKNLALAPETMQRLTEFSWPGNVRELLSVVAELVARLPSDREIVVTDLPREIRESRAADGRLRVPLGSSLAEVERQLILETLRFCQGNREKTARMLGIGLRTLYRKIRRYRARPES